MELEVSYNENYCVEGQVERQRWGLLRVAGGSKQRMQHAPAAAGLQRDLLVRSEWI